MCNKEHISVAKDYSVTPGARFRSDGPYSGQEFFEDKLKPILDRIWDSDDKLVLNLDGTYGYASSFISEVFNEIKITFRDTHKILEKIEIVSEEDPMLKKFISRILHNGIEEND